jgi:hypothetical protein
MWICGLVFFVNHRGAALRFVLDDREIILKWIRRGNEHRRLGLWICRVVVGQIDSNRFTGTSNNEN